MKYPLSIFLIFCSSVFMAQPGYMGKKFSISYAFEPTPFVTKWTRIEEGRARTTQITEQKRAFHVVLGHHAQFGLVLNRKTEFLGHLGFRKLEYFSATDTWTSINYVYDAYEFSGDIGLRHYFGNSIAPVGGFHQFTIGGVAGRISNQFEDPIPVSVYHFSYGLGAKRILFRNVFFQTEFNLNFNVASSSDFAIKAGTRAIDPYLSYYTDYIHLASEIITAQNLVAYNRYNLKFGIGMVL